MLKDFTYALSAVFAAATLAACGAGGPGEPDDRPDAPGGGSGPSGTALETREATARFFTQSTFGPTPDLIDRWTGREAEVWFENQLSTPPTFMAPQFDRHMSLLTTDGYSGFRVASPTLIFWETAVGAPDQLRQRMAFALSQILVTSAATGQLRSTPEGMVYYQDLLIEHALGNYRDLLEDVTYSPAMGYYLTYLGSRKANPDTGEMPDENYARELLQLFTIGVEDIDMQGRRLGGELYDNVDITELAKVFTGFEYAFRAQNAQDRRDRMREPLVMNEEHHSDDAKSFLGLTIPAGTGGRVSVSMALDHIMEQPTMAPFIARQLIQRLVTSHPSPEYVGRVAEAFDTGRYRLPNMVQIGDGRRGDLAATAAAILFDPEARDGAAAMSDPTFGKVREPILRLTHWARAFEIDPTHTELAFDLYDTGETNELAQHPYQAPSVFNFYRPGYVAPGSLTGEAGLTMPELQLVSSATTPGYVNFIDDFILEDRDERDLQRIRDKVDRYNANLPASAGVNAWVARYEAELALVETPDVLLDRLDVLLVNGALSAETRALVLDYLQAEAAAEAGEPTREALVDRVQFAVLLIFTSPDYIVQR